MTETRHTFCPLDCPDTCAIEAIVENGRITRLQGNPEHPTTRGFICRKMRHYHQRIHSPDRILFPQLRTGDKGEGRFQRISWDETWSILVERLNAIRETHGGEALLPYSYAGNMGHISRWAGEPFFFRYGATRLKRTICSAAAGAAWRSHCGNRAGTPPEYAADADLIVAWGINVKTTNMHFWPIIQQSRRKGGKLVVIDPYRNKTAKAATLYLPVNPGGDAALAMGALKMVLEKGGESQRYIDHHTTGFEHLRSYIENLSWPEIETASGITRTMIEPFVDLLLRRPRCFIRIGMGLTRNTTGAMSVRAILCLAAALGLMAENRGQGVLLSSRAFFGNTDALQHPSLADQPAREVNMIHLGKALTQLQPPVFGLMVFNSNPLSAAPDTSQVRKGLLRSDLFTVVHEQVMTPTARYADLLLPATTAFENSDVYTAYGHFYMGRTAPVVPPVGEAISNFDFFQTLAQKLGYTDPPFLQSVDDRIRAYLTGLSGIDPALNVDLLEPGKWIQSVHTEPNLPMNGQPFQFSNPELAPLQAAYPCLTVNSEFGDPDLASRYLLKLITPPASDLLNSTFGDLYPNRRGRLLIHPIDATEHGIKNNDTVRVFNHRGETLRKAKVTEDTQPGLLVAEGLFWEALSSSRSGINDLTSQKCTDLGEGSTFHESRVAMALADPADC